jgi:exopolysaccharide biosynthesis polyprenyl glycosylphosphotransferase
MERRALLILLELLAVNGVLLLWLHLRPEYEGSWSTIVRYPHWFLLLSALWLLLAFTCDAYEPRTTARFASSARAVATAGLITSGVYLLIPYLTPPLPSARSLLFAFPVLLLLALVGGRGLYILAFTRSPFGRRALIIGAGWAGRAIAEALAEHGGGMYQVVGFVDDDPAKSGKEGEEQGNPGATRTSPPRPNAAVPLRVLGDRHSLLSLVRQHHVDTLILAIADEVSGELLQTLTDCMEEGVEVVPMPLLYEQLTGRVPVEHMGSSWYVAMPLSHPLTRTFNQMVKRAMDIVLASLGMLFLAPLFPFIALAIYLDSRGPIFYSQRRVGKGGRIFTVYKFRSMVPDAEKGRAVWAQENDPRVTRVGRFLRKTHIDELPQLWNVLKGEMSAVGPRPERPEFVEELAREIPFYSVRHAVKPGMAGWALVKYGYASSKEDALIRLQYDLYYIKHWSPWLDLVILLKTVVSMLTLRGRA